VASPPGITLVSPRVVNVTRGTNEYPVTVRVSEDLRPGTYNVRMIISLQNGSSAEATANLRVVEAPRDFSIALNPQSLSLTPGSSGDIQLTLTPRGGFTGTVNLELVGAPNGVGLSPTSLAVSTGPVSQTLTLSVGSNVAPGNYALRLRASSGNLVKEADLALTVSAPPSFELAVDPTSLNTRVGETVTLTVTLTPQGRFQGAVLISLNAPDFAEASPVQTGVNLVNGQASASFRVRGTGEGSGTLTVRAESGTIVKTLSVPLRVQPPQGLSASVDPARLTVYQGNRASFTLRLTPSGGLSGVVALSLQRGSAPVSWANLTPYYVTIAPSGEQSFSIAMDVAPEAPTGTHSLTLKLAHNAGETTVPIAVEVREPTFHIALSRSSFTLCPGRFDSAVLSLTTEGGFSGTVDLSLEGNGAGDFDLFPRRVNTSASTWGLLITNRGASTPGTYNLTLQATSGRITRTVPITVTVPPPPGFVIAVEPPNLTVTAGESGRLALTVTPRDGFTGTLTLSLRVLDTNGNEVRGFSLNPTSVDVNRSNPQTFPLTLSVGEGVNPGSYLAALEAASDCVTHTAYFQVTVR
jgi:hypothetical protein